jgi:hypothetical protein
VALIDYLRSQPLDLPTPITSTKAVGEGQGSVTSNITNGDLFLVDAEGKAFRLSWQDGASDKPEARVLPAGEYSLRTYRIARKQQGQDWHLSATAPKIQKVEVLEGKSVAIKVRHQITITSNVQGRMGTMNIIGAPKVGLSIYRDQKRIPIDYRVLDADGKPLATGAMRYG